MAFHPILENENITCEEEKIFRQRREKVIFSEVERGSVFQEMKAGVS